jgi:hypothetical protein
VFKLHIHCGDTNQNIHPIDLPNNSSRNDPSSSKLIKYLSIPNCLPNLILISIKTPFSKNISLPHTTIQESCNVSVAPIDNTATPFQTYINNETYAFPPTQTSSVIIPSHAQYMRKMSKTLDPCVYHDEFFSLQSSFIPDSNSSQINSAHLESKLSLESLTKVNNPYTISNPSQQSNQYYIPDINTTKLTQSCHLPFNSSLLDPQFVVVENPTLNLTNLPSLTQDPLSKIVKMFN